MLTLAGHTAAGGAADAVGLILVTGLAVVLGWALSTVRLGPARVFGVLVGGQALLHLVLTITSAHGHGGAAAGPSAHAMVAAHLVAALLATAVIVHADGIAAAWQAFLSVLLGTPWTPALAVEGRPSDRSITAPGPSPARRFLTDQVVRRGPPASDVTRRLP